MLIWSKNFWAKDAWPVAPANWDEGRWEYVEVDGERVRHGWADVDYHVDLGCGRLKKGRIGIDHRPDPGVNVVMDLNRVGYRGAVKGLPHAPGGDAVPVPASDVRGEGQRLPFSTSSIESIVSHHCLEHIGDGFMALMDDVYRVLEPGGLLYAITPLFPSRVAVDDPTHRRYFMEQTWGSFCGTPGDEPENCWLAGFSTPYTQCRFEQVDLFATPLPDTTEGVWGPGGVRELRVVLRARK